LKTTRLVISEYGDDGGYAWAKFRSSKENTHASIIFSWGAGWDHVSVSFHNRVPTWGEMCEAKNMFFYKDEVCFQLHPAESEYVNMHPHCLHIWRPQNVSVPTPPSWMVGAKKNQPLGDVIREGVAASISLQD